MAYSPWSISSTIIDIFFEYVVPKWMLWERTHVDEQNYVFFLSDFIFYDNFSQTESILTFDLNIFE